MLTISNVFLVSVTAIFLMTSYEVNNDHSKLKYLNNINPDVKSFCEKEAKKYYYTQSIFGPDINELVALENCVKTINPESLQAKLIISDSEDIKLRFSSLIINGATPESIVFIPNIQSTVSVHNMLDPSMSQQVSTFNKNVIKTSDIVTIGSWIYNPSNFKVKSVKSNQFDQTIILAGIKKNICEEINYQIYRYRNIPVINIANAESFIVGSTLANPTTNVKINISNTPETDGWTSGCIGTNSGGDDNVFFRVLKTK